jgi:glycosyltransferase involved in cell wall biosynthesis
MPIIPHGLVERPDGEQVLRARRSEQRPYVVLFVGRLEPRKGIEYVLKTIPQVLEQVPDTCFVIVGQDSPTAPGGRLWQEHFRQTCAIHHQQAVSFAGFVPGEELRRFYQHCDVFIAPSLYESFGLIHLEAMSWGAPVVAFRTAATPEVVIGGETGILIEPGNVEGLAQAIVRLLSDFELRREMGRQALTWAAQFSIEHTVAETVAVYREALAQR